MKRLLVVSNMYPSPIAPSFGVFVRRHVRALEALGVSCRVVSSSRRGGSAAGAASKYADLLSRSLRAAGGGPDAVLAHYVFPTGAIGLAAGRRARVPVAVVAHGGDVSPEKPAPLLAAAGLVLRRADVVVAVSNAIASDVASLGASPEKIVVASMGYDEDAFVPRDRGEARARLGLEDGRPYAAFVGSLIARKGIGVLIDAAARLRTLFPELRWLVVGGGSERGRWEHAAAAAGSAEAVRFVGPVAPEDVAVWMSAADLVVVPSLREPLGVAALEAMACGVPVVASRTGGLAEIVSDAESGILVPPGDADALAGAVVTVMGDGALRERLAAAGPVAAKPNTVAHQAGKLLDALERRTAGG